MNELENIHELSNHEVFIMFEIRIRHYAEAMLRKNYINYTELLTEIEVLKNELLSRMHTPDVIKLRVK